MTKDETLKQLVAALEYHTAQTRPITQTQEAIAAGKAAIEQTENQDQIRAITQEAHQKINDLEDEIRRKVYGIPPAQPAVPEGWQLIETAPQDGTKILGWNEEFGARETKMNFYGEGSLGFAAWKSGKGPKESGWNWSEPKSNWGHTWKPTHWKPLLTPCNTTTPNVATPPAAQRQWVGLEREIAAAVLDHCYGHGGVSDDMIERTTEVIEAKLKERNV